uniref:Uncharacterized protein n=1 Tax=Florenciella sp. virus SA2 TaxID=3240092 RepID=A0AB39JAZ1_9VIRU
MEKHSKIYRFKITNTDLYEEMIHFANINKFLDRKDLKEKYEEWSNKPEIKSYIEDEIAFLSRNNYNFEKTNISEKIFKSIKYYHINNMKNEMKMTSLPIKKDKDKKTKSKNIKFSNIFIQKVKSHLNELKGGEHIPKPSECYDLFIELNNEMIKEEKNNLDITDKEFEFKLKKMLKNQYFMLFKK